MAATVLALPTPSAASPPAYHREHQPIGRNTTSSAGMPTRGPDRRGAADASKLAVTTDNHGPPAEDLIRIYADLI